MKKITLNSSTVGGQSLSTLDLIIGAVNTPPQGGFDAKAMGKSCRILGRIDRDDLREQIKAAPVDIDFEDADFDYIRECLERARYTIPSPFILETLKQFNIEA